jgi:hypothetical protein
MRQAADHSDCMGKGVLERLGQVVHRRCRQQPLQTLEPLRRAAPLEMGVQPRRELVTVPAPRLGVHKRRVGRELRVIQHVE